MFHSSQFITAFSSIIPKTLPNKYKSRPSDFTRNRKLNLQELFTFILHLSSTATDSGVRNKLINYFSKPWNIFKSIPKAEAVCKSRQKVSWKAFEEMFYETVELAKDHFPKSAKYQWNSMDVLAVDGSKFQLPFTEKLREEFDPKCGLNNRPSKGHYPQALVTTIHDVFRQIPIARSIAPSGSCERKEFIKLLDKIEYNSLLIFDRGYPSYKMFQCLNESDKSLKYLFRCSTSHTFSAVKEFVQSSEHDKIIEVTPTRATQKELGEKCCKTIKLRAIKIVHNGELKVFFTNLFDTNKYKYKEICDLYKKRWSVETYYAHEKVSMSVDRFHSKKSNGVKQELFASCIMTLVAKTIAAINTQEDNIGVIEPQIKNAVLVLSSNISLINCREFVKDKYQNWLFEQMISITYLYKKKPRSYPRINKGPKNKWKKDRPRKTQEFEKRRLIA